MLSFWETESFLRHDFVVVGAGVVGLFTAWNLKERYPGASVVVLERGLLPSGASTKNVGFLSVSTLSEVIADREELGDHALLENISRRKRGIQALRERLGDAEIGYEPYGGYELLLEKDLPLLSQLEETNHFLQTLFPRPVFRRADDRLPTMGFSPASVKGLVFNPFDAQIATGRAMRRLIDCVQRAGVQIATGAEVTRLETAGPCTIVGVRGVSGELELQADQVAVCTNALVPRLLPDLPIVPARGQVLITEPLPELPWRGTFNFDAGYFYFRDVGQRVIVGGGRHTDKATEETAVFALNDRIQARLEQAMREIILPGRKVRIEHRWSGIMGFSKKRTPLIRRLGPRLVVGFGCNSMGLAMGAETGRETAALVA